MRRFSFVGAVLLLVLLAACQERLAGPADCPELCPGTGLDVREVLLTPIAGLDSSYYGYLNTSDITSLLISDGVPAGEARAVMAFPKRPDSVLVDNTTYPFSTIDSVAVTVKLAARDSTVGGLKLYFHRVSPVIDSTLTVASVDAQLTPATLIDSLIVPDSVKRDTVRLVLTGDKIDRIQAFESDSFRLGIGVRMKAAEPTGIRLDLSAGIPTITTYVHVAVTDTAKAHQVVAVSTDNADYVITELPPVPAGDLFLGGRLGSRTLLRFSLPKFIKDSASPIRATLELTPSASLIGIRNDFATMLVSGVLTDLGPKSPAVTGAVVSTVLGVGTSAVQSAEVLPLVTTWFAPEHAPPTEFLLSLLQETGTFARPQFYSSRGPADRVPRLRLTYVVPTRPGHP